MAPSDTHGTAPGPESPPAEPNSGSKAEGSSAEASLPLEAHDDDVIDAFLAAVAASPEIPIDLHTGEFGNVAIDPLPALPAKGERVADRYIIEELLQRGGFGVVFKGRDIETKRDVAIKIVSVGAAAFESNLTRMALFRRETSVLAGLSHPNIVPLHDAGSLGKGQLYAVMPYIEGETLAAAIERDGPMEGAEAIRLMTQVLDALVCAHDRGVVHRDLKPANIMLTSAGGRRNAVILDFGLAAPAEELRDDAYESLIATEHIICSPAYAAPEQLRKRTTPQTDLYAWGLILLECLSGEPVAPVGPSYEVMSWQASDTPIEIPAWLAALELGKILARAVAKPLEARAQSATELLRRLEAIDARAVPTVVERAALEAAPAPALRPPIAWRAPAVLAGLLVILIALFLGFSRVQHDTDTDLPPSPPTKQKASPAAQPRPPSSAPVRVEDRCRAGERQACLTLLAGPGALREKLEVSHGQACDQESDLCRIGQHLWRPLGTHRGQMHLYEGGTFTVGLSPAELEAERAACRTQLSPFEAYCEREDIFPAGEQRVAAEAVIPPFFLDEYEATQEQWDACVRAGVCPALQDESCLVITANGTRQHASPPHGEASLPKGCVDHASATSFCDWAGKRLPSEAEWELAARAADPSSANGADLTLIGAMRWSPDDSPLFYQADLPDGHALAAPVGSLSHDPSMPADLLGNVAEWVVPDYDEQGNHAGTRRGVVRGGGYLDVIPWLGPRLRVPLPLGERRADVGVRCALSADEVVERAKDASQED